MGRILHSEVVSLDTTLEALTLGNTRNIDLLALLEQINLEFGAQLDVVD